MHHQRDGKMSYDRLQLEATRRPIWVPHKASFAVEKFIVWNSNPRPMPFLDGHSTTLTNNSKHTGRIWHSAQRICHVYSMCFWSSTDSPLCCPDSSVAAAER
uniref:Uncharacterized protein n=1 Tax=Rhipicephalus zambeziensis TaxID=60191 RepID=A0A224YHN7_9ACAR